MIEYTFKQTTEAVRLCIKELEMTTETKQNNYSLLREFNLEQAQSGDEILHIQSPSFTYTEVIHEVKFKGVTSNLQEVFLEDNQGEGYVRGTQRVKMKPLCWIEGKPVYKGDKLWYKSKVHNSYYQHEAHCLVDNCLFNENGTEFLLVSSLSWDKPKEPHVHQDLIDAWNNGAEIQYYNPFFAKDNKWCKTESPEWQERTIYRIKPQEKPHNTPRYIQYYPTWQDAAVDLCKNPRKGSVEIRWEE